MQIMGMMVRVMVGGDEGKRVMEGTEVGREDDIRKAC